MLTQPRTVLTDKTAVMILLCAIIALVMGGMGLVGPVLPIFAEYFQINNTWVGLLITSFGLGRLVLDIPAGFLSEIYGRRVVLFSGPAIISVSSLGCALASSFAGLIFFRFLQGMGSALYTTAAMTVAVDLSDSSNRGRYMSFYQGSILIGVGIGPILGGFLAGRWGYQGPFYLFALLTALATVAVWLYLPDTRKEGPLPSGAGDRKPSQPGKTIRSLLLNRDFVLALLLIFGIFFTRAGSQMDMLPLFGSSALGLNEERIGLALSVVALMNILVLLPAGGIVDRWGSKSAIIPGNILAGAALILLPLTSTYAGFLLVSALMGIGMGIGGPAPAAYAANIAPPQAYGLTMGLVRAFGDVGYVAAPIFLGYLADYRGYTFSLGLAGYLLIVLAVAFGLWGREQGYGGASLETD